MTTRRALLLFLAAAACATAPPGPAPAPARPLADLPPLPRSSIVAVLGHRNELQLTEQQSARLEQADAELQQALGRLRAEGVGSSPATGHRAGHGPPPSDGPGGGRPGGGGAGRHGGGEGSVGGPSGGAPRQEPARAHASLDTLLDDADTAAFLKAEAILTDAQRDRAREIAERYREQRFERRELLRGR